MKLSVIFGVAQMTLGICMKAMNSIYFRQELDFYYEFIPQVVLLLSLFGWLDFLIIMKWLTPWEGNTSRAPGIVNMMISMFLNFGVIDTETTDSIVGNPSTQQTICIVLLIIALCCVPIMLLLKPFVIYQELKSHEENPKSEVYEELQNVDHSVEHEGREKEENFGFKAVEITKFIEENRAVENHNFSEL